MVNLSKNKDEIKLRQALEGCTEFQKEVLIAVSKIPPGKVSTYSRIAKIVGRPNAYRAVANTMNKGPDISDIPYHRVVSSDGSFSGNPTWAARRRERIKAEGVPVSGGRVRMTKEILY